ncbi:glycoside hydrolase family 3 C-terminal domain-containing protein [Pseudobacter ginsenosidimutans]|uniref:Beta-glucosidase n=1 Tax=Pseudobacter ginsenosidimutans TaxID=661488 RepID=A0A4Q7MX56_9BACT|nr:glycoside hydrolase family 3 C-terminal domain-containing protein [Pseudobacter ginsenosidimutans]QEC40612.1 glycosyl hydrolase [Pseudobacter ginsenosidimutans]RZS72669.1 beta-glucosidase [Pseudobacter ginsenosidimutans]
MKKLAAIFLLLSASQIQAQEYKTYPMWDHKLPTTTRVRDLISRLTLEEKVAQMLNAAPAVEKLGIPAYDWWNEVLHGVARTPFKVTVFPQAIGMAATWDTSSLFTMAKYAATEGRAINNIAIKKNRTRERYLGLTYWTPNINIFRDPRWGRGQETYGEDPFLTAMLGSAFVHGLQGDDPRYLQAAACAKHYAVHSGPEPSRHSFNANVSAYDLWDTYLPAFKELITNAKVAGVMCAYNAFRDQPCCASDLLMNDILRNQWQFNGYVTSDCWAIDDFFKYHKTHKDATVSAADAVLHGTDVECGVSVYKTLVDAVKQNIITEKQLDVSLERLFTIRYRLGQFDPPSMVPYTQIDESVLESETHKAHSLKMAQQSIVLLKNQNNTLPLKRSIKKIALIGPNADNPIAVLGNYNGMPSEIITVLKGLQRKLGNDVEIIYEKAVNFTDDSLLIFEDLSSFYSTDGKPGVKAEYWNNEKMEGSPDMTITEKDIHHYWPEGQSPATGINTIHFSARYTTVYTARETEALQFEASGDDGYRIFINDELKLDAWERNRWGARKLSLETEKGKQYRIRVEMYQGEGNAAIQFKAGKTGRTNIAALKERIKDADVILFAGGISPQLEGEEMKVDYPGFNGGDRTSIMLPAIQTKYLQELKSTGKPVVFIMMTGSAIAIPWEDQNIPGIINAWYGGQHAGTAIADVLFGDYNPAGRLPVTFYASDKDLPDFNSYEMKGRTYRYFNGKPLYPFGYGLSYSNFTYDGFALPATHGKGKALTVKVRVSNIGKMDGEEVVQLYVSHTGKTETAPLRALKGFQRIALKAGESRMVEFTLSPDMLSVVSKDGKLVQPAEKIWVSIGGGQPAVKNKTTSLVLSKSLSIQ